MCLIRRQCFEMNPTTNFTTFKAIVPLGILHITVTCPVIFQMKKATNKNRKKFMCTFVFALFVIHIIVGSVDYKDEEYLRSAILKKLGHEYDYFLPVTKNNPRFDEDTIFYYGLTPYTDDKDHPGILQLAKLQFENLLSNLILNLCLSTILFIIFATSVTCTYSFKNLAKT